MSAIDSTTILLPSGAADAATRSTAELNDAFLTLPGGIGTCEEFFEVWTAGVLGIHGKPVVLLDPDGHFAGLLDWLRGLVGSGFVRPHALDRVAVVRDVEAALDACAPA